MEKEIIDRVLKHAKLFMERDQTIRTVSKRTGWSKNTVHLDLTKKLPLLHRDYAELVMSKILKNKAARSHRGGQATKDKWAKKNKKVI